MSTACPTDSPSAGASPDSKARVCTVPQQSWEEAGRLCLWSSGSLSLQVLGGCALYTLSGFSTAPERLDGAHGWESLRPAVLCWGPYSESPRALRLRPAQLCPSQPRAGRSPLVTNGLNLAIVPLVPAFP